MHVDDIDELAGDTIPCSPSAFFRDRDSNTTQPTQLLSKPSLGRMRSSSPASSIIEVPASSPFQQPKKSAPLATRLAPAGTVFRPPARLPAMPQKRPAPEAISLLSDDEDDLTPPRGDIRPTTFKAQISAYAYNPQSQEGEDKIREKLRQIYDVFGDDVPARKAREALKLCRNDLDDTIDYITKNQTEFNPTPKPQPAAKPKGRRLISKGALQATSSSRSISRDRSRTVSPSPPKKPRRRLVQGLRHLSTQSSQQAPIHIPSSDDPLVIDLVGDDNEDTYRADASPTPDLEGDDRVLNSINTSTVKELAALTGMKESQLEIMIEKRPFENLAKARKVTINKKPGARKAAKISIGENVVDAVEVFLNAVHAIDEVVSKCEADAKAIKDQLDTWDLDSFGHEKEQKQRRGGSADEDDLPPTPTSLTGSRLIRPPISRQPEMMDGHCVMKPFQLFGLNWMSVLYKFNIGCILADEMGLGKTCQVISLFSHLVESYQKKPQGDMPWPNLVVVPPSTYNNWLAEFEKFAPDLSVVGYRGSQAERAELAYEVASDPDAYHVVLATYTQISTENDIEAMQSFNLNAAVFDEGHKMKNPETKGYKDLRKIRASWKMLLTGMFSPPFFCNWTSSSNTI